MCDFSSFHFWQVGFQEVHFQQKQKYNIAIRIINNVVMYIALKLIKNNLNLCKIFFFC